MAMAGEEWRDVKGFKGRYSVSNLGRVRSERRRVRNNINGAMRTVQERILSQHPVHGGYLCVWIYDWRRRQRAMKVAHLVAEAFLGPRRKGIDVCHNNGIRTDNRACNLRYASRSENMADARAHGTLACGEKHGASKLTEADVRAIRNDTRKLTEIAAEFGISFQHVSALKKGTKWRWLENK